MNEKGKNIVLVVLILLAVLLSGYICYDKLFIKDANANVPEEQEENINKKEEGTLDIQSRLVQDLYNKVKSWQTNCLSAWIFGRDEFDVNTATEEQKMKIIYNNIDVQKIDFISCGRITGSIPSGTRCESNIANYVNVLYGDYIRSLYRNIFGNTGSFQNISFDRWEYISQDDLYISKEVISGTTCATHDTFELVGAKRVNDTIQLEEKYIAVGEYISAEEYQPSQEWKFIYTFRLDDDGLYSFVSRTKAN